MIVEPTLVECAGEVPPLHPGVHSEIGVRHYMELPRKRKRVEPVPRFTLTGKNRTPAVSELHNLLLWVLSEHEGRMPKWIFVQNKHLIRKLVVLFLPGADLFSLQRNQAAAPFLNSLVRDTSICCVLRPSAFGYLQATLNRDEFIPCATGENHPVSLGDLLLTTEEKGKNGVPESGEGFLELTNESPHELLAVDCEMVMTTNGSQLARISIVGEDLAVLYDAFIRPGAPVTDYLTQYSGITEEIVQDAQETIETLHSTLPSIVGRNTVLCGHSIENDLKAMKLVHSRVADTSVMYPHPAEPFKFSLKQLTNKFLNKNIQNGAHNSVEDATAAMQLVQLKLQNGSNFGLPAKRRRPRSLFTQLSLEHKKSVVTGSDFPSSLIEGNVSVDLKGSLAKYLDSDYDLVLGEWNNIKDCKLLGEPREAFISEVLSQWDCELQSLLHAAAPGTGFILANGQGDTYLAEQLQSEQSSPCWGLPEELALNSVLSGLQSTLGFFLFSSSQANY